MSAKAGTAARKSIPDGTDPGSRDMIGWGAPADSLRRGDGVRNRGTSEGETGPRRRALRAALAVTLGVGMAASVSGCEAVTDAYCGVFENSRFCCEREGWGTWDEATRSCEPTMIEGPFVPPEMPT